ncbi:MULTISPECIES: hypothetical protein [Pseudonocardia]|uniref:Uncharacterized protein n=2 Tax=Pseudonocardia TaxID=1847 RepID=A0A1Y2MS93_PSEAH|nr:MULTISPECIES: hypothetical protein [Pseudonocardia]OSY37388.1 hypothetical protein BG845_04683 [Pseudonocardia autotrophica]TDN77286.1 hypothetical protein C8E95_6531 [Pseudonocardia autotrophica]BBG01306.1 hypothetical protein Pdca_25150 [Pseudonocardia autotrophica]GEC26033.1 hypothetical protein PSA01_30620 [Pseudonocardia saturnea]
MAGKGGRSKFRELGALALMAGILYVVVDPLYGPVIYTLLACSLLMIWVLFIMPTKCGYDLGPRGCANPVRGKLNGCHYHDDLKRDALFAAMRMRNPGQYFRVKWNDGSTPRGRTWGAASIPPSSAVERSNARQGSYDMVMLLITAIGSVAGVLALFLAD